MQGKHSLTLSNFLIILLVTGLACSFPALWSGNPTPPPPQPSPIPPATPMPESTNTPLPTNTPSITHIDFPAEGPQSGRLIYDVESSGTAPEKRAPYGDSYDIYRMERPFSQDMTYIPDMDIHTFNVRIDVDWVYVSLELIGTDPNNPAGIKYGVELDLDADGFGEYILWAQPPFTPEWSTNGVQVLADQNRDTGGLSAEKSDAPLEGDGYETVIFDAGVGDDPDLAWVRIDAGTQATVQFAFKPSLSGSTFMLGVLSDAGLGDVTQMYYNDRFTEEQAGSPEKSESEYPLKALYAFDNTCREAFGFNPTGYEPLLCPRPEPEKTEKTCENPSQYTDQASCEAAHCLWVQNPAVVLAIAYHCVAP